MQWVYFNIIWIGELVVLRLITKSINHKRAPACYIRFLIKPDYSSLHAMTWMRYQFMVCNLMQHSPLLQLWTEKINLLWIQHASLVRCKTVISCSCNTELHKIFILHTLTKDLCFNTIPYDVYWNRKRHGIVTLLLTVSTPFTYLRRSFDC